MASRDRRSSFDRIHSNSRREGDRSADEALLNDDRPRPSVSRPTVTLRRGSNPQNLLPTDGRSHQPGDEPETREVATQTIDRQSRHPQVRFDPQQDQVNITMDAPASPQPPSSERPRKKGPKSPEDDTKFGTKIANCAGIIIVIIIIFLFFINGLRDLPK
ncbi:uncharacterized protein LOC106653730 [Trichogramma pretiosum]|uniref:uncharacterized protein LOC106653730 n=1 Tax=Trichogramma pretiosum TaxID=7493 RepID=UPI0006C95A86|nr:uncharacterized protein LOC106653730 [Trichogramma pretiosum]